MKRPIDQQRLRTAAASENATPSLNHERVSVVAPTLDSARLGPVSLEEDWFGAERQPGQV